MTTNNKTMNRQQKQQLWFDFPNKNVSIGSSIGSGTSNGHHEFELNNNKEEEKEDYNGGGYHEDDHVVFDDDDDDDDDRMKLVALDTRRGSTRYEICEQCQLSSRSLGKNLNHCGSYDDAEFGQSAHEASIATHMLHCPHRHYDEELENEYYNEGSGGSSNHFFSSFNIYSGGSRGSNKHSSSSHYYYNLCCCYRRTLFVLATIGIIALTTTVFFGNTIHPTSSSSMMDNTATSNNNNTFYYGNNGDGQQPQQLQDTTVVVVPEAPAELSIACTYMNNDNNDNTISQQSQQTCIELCTPGSCCLMSGSSNCFASNPRICQDYILCPIDPTTNQPITTFGGIGGGASAGPLPAMDDLNELCSSTSIATEGGRDVCHELCIGGLCCIGQDSDDCSTSYPNECQAYQPCHLIWSADGVYDSSTNNNDAPPLPLNGLCSSLNLKTTKGQEECSKACQFGTCCFDGTCLDTHPLICDEYKFCPQYHQGDLITTTTHKHPVPYPINDLDVICSSDTPEGQQTCLEECLKGTCCFEEGEHQNCFSDNQASCEAYEICVTVLPSTDSMLGTDTVISPVEALCSVENILSKDERRELCESICSYGKCCFEEDESLSCQTQHLDICESYHFCSLLTVVPEAPENLADLCMISTHGGNHECERICAVASCCFSTDGAEHGPCQPTNVKACASYEGICHNKSNSQGITDEGSVIAVSESEEISPLASICSDIHKLTSDEGRQQCHEECAPAKCCVVSDPNENCYIANPEECDEYKLYCMDMWDLPQQTEEEEQATSYSVSPMSLICSKDAILTEEGRSKCSNECDHATCCDAESVVFNCYDSNKEWCDEVSIYCRILD